MEGSLLVKFKFTLFPLQRFCALALVMVGGVEGETFNVIDSEYAHPSPSTIETVYVVVAAGEAVTNVPVVADKPVAGDQLYVNTGGVKEMLQSSNVPVSPALSSATKSVQVPLIAQPLKLENNCSGA